MPKLKRPKRRKEESAADLITRARAALDETHRLYHRHPGGNAARIGLVFQDGRLHLEVADNGRCFPPGVLKAVRQASPAAGVSISGMRDRLRLLGGELQIHSDPAGTQVIASVPLLNGELPQ